MAVKRDLGDRLWARRTGAARLLRIHDAFIAARFKSSRPDSFVKSDSQTRANANHAAAVPTRCPAVLAEQPDGSAKIAGCRVHVSLGDGQ